MPTISMFYGIIIQMFFNEHMPPHFHAKYQGFKATYTFDGERMDGDMPKRAEKLIVAWAELHSDELAANWELAQSHDQLYGIEPLR